MNTTILQSGFEHYRKEELNWCCILFENISNALPLPR